MSLIQSKKIYYINSRDRSTGTDGDFTYIFNIPPNNKFTHVVLLQCIIPKSYYLVNNSNSTFTLEENAQQVTITTPVGNYTRRSFQTVIQSELNTNSPNGWTYTVSYNNISTQAETGKYIFTVSGNGGIQPKIIINSDGDLFEPLGFDRASTNTFSGDTLNSANTIKLQLEDTLFLHSDICHNESDNILQEIFASKGDPSFSNILFQQFSIEAYSKELNSNTNNTYRFFLTDEDGHGINLNSLNMEFSIMLYEKNNIFDIIKDGIKLFAMQ